MWFHRRVRWLIIFSFLPLLGNSLLPYWSKFNIVYCWFVVPIDCRFWNSIRKTIAQHPCFLWRWIFAIFDFITFEFYQSPSVVASPVVDVTLGIFSRSIHLKIFLLFIWKDDQITLSHAGWKLHEWMINVCYSLASFLVFITLFYLAISRPSIKDPSSD